MYSRTVAGIIGRMTMRVLESVPNFSEGRDLGVVRAIVGAIEGAGAEVLDWSADPDHHRCVITMVGPPEVVEDAAVAGARVARDAIDLRRHKGVHPRIGALDVLPFVPLTGLDLEDARRSARKVGARIADELGIPVYFYGQASEPRGRELAELRRGGYERLVRGWPDDRVPDLLPAGWPYPGAHPTAGAVCVGARSLLLAWNVYVTGLELAEAARIASAIREAGGGFRGLRALALELPSRGEIQISMNLTEVTETSPLAVLRRIEEMVEARGGRTNGVEVIGMIPDELVFPAAVERLSLRDATMDRLLSRRLAAYLSRVEQSPVPRYE